ncbi:hypothetical protein ACJJTC_003083 [Scirpophaga incertulas]
MDFPKDLNPINNTLQLGSHAEMGRNCRNLSLQSNENDNSENIFTSTSNVVDSNFTSQKYPNTVQTNTLNTESSQSTSKSSDSNLDTTVNAGSSVCNNANNRNEEIIVIAGPSNAGQNFYDNNKDVSSPKRKADSDKASKSASCNLPSTSGPSKDNEHDDSNSVRENRKRPSTLKLNRPNDAEDSSSDTGNDDYSLGSEDGCFYTYRGGEHLADLPSSFFSLDMGLPLENQLPHAPNYAGPQQAPTARENNSGASSPDMDFLEMDFDPGPSCEVETGDESSPDGDLEAAINMPIESEPVLRGTSPEYTIRDRTEETSAPTTSQAAAESSDVPSTSEIIIPVIEETVEESSQTNNMGGPFITHVNVRGEQLLVRRTMSRPHVTTVNHHVSTGDLVSPREVYYFCEDFLGVACLHQINHGERPAATDPNNQSSTKYHVNMMKKLIESIENDPEQPGTSTVNEAGSNNDESNCTPPPRSMVWSEREACERQVTQIAASACGATAVINVFNALGVPVDIERINSAVGTRPRANHAPLPRYLLSRAVAGCTAADIVNGIQRASDGLVTARFFPTYPERVMSLSHWLADWISLGAVPILTLNLQIGCEGEIPDAWHHQMVFGVTRQGIYLCNPIECVRESTLWGRLTSPSELLVRTRDVIMRFTSTTDLTPLMSVPDERFNTFNVLGQVATVIREWRSSGITGRDSRTRYVRIPAAYQAGITIAVLTGSEAHRRLMHAAQLPILEQPKDK